MCIYCMLADHTFKYDPPFIVDPIVYPYVPQPRITLPVNVSWTLKQCREYLRLLKAIKKMEDKLGCPCIPAKTDYIKLMEDHIASRSRSKRK